MVHVIGDIVQSVGVCVAAALIWAFSDRWLDASGVSYWYRVDPVCTYLFSLLVLYSSYGTMSEAVHLLMAGVPSDINISEVRSRLKAIPCVVGAHDVHVWALSASKRNMWAHLTVSAGADSASVLHAAQRAAADFGCDHTCFQLEGEGTVCAALHCGPPDVAHDHSHA